MAREAAFRPPPARALWWAVRLLRGSNAADPPDLDIAVERDDQVAVVSVTGELDLASVPQLRSCLTDLIGRGEVHLVVDLGGVTFCDSTALGVFVGAHRRVTASNGRIEFHQPPPSLRNLLVVSGLDQILTVR
jgi:anti-sigma B factor antagonist